MRICLILGIGAIAHAAAVDWDTDISGAFVGGDGSVALVRLQEGSISKTCDIAKPGEVNTSSTRSFGDWQDHRVCWALANASSGTTKLWTVELPNQDTVPCNVSHDQLPFEIVAMHAASKGNQFLVLSRTGGLFKWESGKQAQKLPMDKDIGDLSGLPLVAHLNDRISGESILVILHDEEKQQRLTEIAVSGSGPASVRQSSFNGCDGHRVRAIYAGDVGHALYAWAVPGRAGLASAYAMNRLSDNTFSCNEIITTGGSGGFVTGAYDGHGSLAMMAPDALYVVGGVNSDPDDLHLPVPGSYAPGNFSTIMYINRRYAAHNAPASVMV